MAGNVWQWCDDVWAESHDLRAKGVFDGSRFLFRGGSFVDPWRRCRTSYFYFAEPEFTSFGLGFRVVLRYGR